MTNSAPGLNKIGPTKVNCNKPATFSSVTYFLKVGQQPAKCESVCDI